MGRFYNNKPHYFRGTLYLAGLAILDLITIVANVIPEKNERNRVFDLLKQNPVHTVEALCLSDFKSDGNIAKESITRTHFHLNDKSLDCFELHYRDDGEHTYYELEKIEPKKAKENNAYVLSVDFLNNCDKILMTEMTAECEGTVLNVYPDNNTKIEDYRPFFSTKYAKMGTSALTCEHHNTLLSGWKGKIRFDWEIKKYFENISTDELKEIANQIIEKGEVEDYSSYFEEDVYDKEQDVNDDWKKSLVVQPVYPSSEGKLPKDTMQEASMEEYLETLDPEHTYTVDSTIDSEIDIN